MDLNQILLFDNRTLYVAAATSMP